MSQSPLNQRLNRKQIISVVSFVAIIFISERLKNTTVSVLFFTIFYFTMLFYWCKEIKKRFCDKWETHKQVRSRNYFYIKDSRNIVDITKRREVGFDLLLVVYIIFFGIVLLVTISRVIQLSVFYNIFLVILSLGIFFVVMAIILHMRYYWTSFYYYVIPIILLGIDNIEEVSSTNFILKYFLLTIFVYSIFTVLLPIPYLRRISNSTFVVSALLSIIIPTVVEHILSNYLLNQISLQEITPNMIVNSGLPQILVDALEVPSVIQVMNDIVRLISPVIIQSQLNIFTTLSFLWLSGYTIGSIIIGVKIKLGDAIAREKTQTLYNEDGEVSYNDLRDIIYFGNESYRDRILDNSHYRMIIERYESNKEILSTNYHWSIKCLIFLWNQVVDWLKLRMM
ncbi:TPA: hypothetical protein ACGO2T_001748 [Streptococcus suis]